MKRKKIVLEQIQKVLPTEFEVSVLQTKSRRQRYLIVVKYPETDEVNKFGIIGFGHSMRGYHNDVQNAIKEFSFKRDIKEIYYSGDKFVIYSSVGKDIKYGKVGCPYNDGRYQWNYFAYIPKREEEIGGRFYYQAYCGDINKLINYLVKSLVLNF